MYTWLLNFLRSADFSSKLTVSKISFRNTIRVSNSFDPDQDQNSVGPYLDPNCLHRLSHARIQKVLSEGAPTLKWDLFF